MSVVIIKTDDDDDDDDDGQTYGHTELVDVQLNEMMRIISGTLQTTPTPLHQLIFVDKKLQPNR